MKKYILILLTFLSFILPAQSQYWQQALNIPAPYNNNYWLDVYFYPGNSLYGWVCGFNGMVIRTTNGGMSWAGDTVQGAYHLESIIFPSTNIGYTSGVEGIWKSTNGGASWFSVKPVQAGDTISFWGCYFYDNNNGMVLGEGCGGTRQYFWRTTNGGTTWTYFNGNEFDSGLTDVILNSNGQGFASSSGKLWHSSDGGYNWAVIGTTGTNLWQEEITYFNQAFLVPYAGFNCQGGGANGGMRFSPDGGTTWRDVNVGVPMFGAFVLNDNEAWACGYNQALYYTSDAGVTWTLKNCGIAPGNLDDIWFIGNNVGWVVGQGVYKYSNATQLISKTMVDFNDGCISSPRFDTLYVRNMNFNSASANWSMSGPDVADFTILQPNSNFTLQPCDSTRFIIEFNPTTGGNKVATLRIDIPGYTTFVVGLVGNALSASVTLSDTLIVVDSADCGKTTLKSVTWKASNTNQYINSYSRTGSPDVSLNTAIPLLLSKTGVDTRFVIVPTDTGWQSARFSFRMFPCNTDTFITVKFYGYSPIINSVKKLETQGECVLFKDLEVPVLNTGNNDLIISNYQIINPPNGFSIIGWKSGKPQPLSLKPFESDTLIVRFQPALPGTYTAKLRLTNNDMTKPRGNVNPYNIDLTGTLLFANVQTRDTSIDLGEICIGDSSSQKIKLWNSGNLSSTLTPVKNSLSEFSFVPLSIVYPIQIKQNDTIFANIKFIPTRTGNYLDTFFIRTFPCDQDIRIIVKGKAVRTQVALSPNKLSGTVYNYSNAQSTCRLTNESTDDITVTGYNFIPALNLWSVTISPSLPVVIAPGAYQDFVFIFTTQQDSSLLSLVCFDISGKCPVNACLDVDYKSINDPIAIMPTPVDFGEQNCAPYLQTKTVTILNLSSAYAKLDTIYVSPANAGFSIQNMPSLPYSLKPLDSLVLTINYLPVTEGTYNAEVVAVCSLSTVKAKLSGSYKQTKLSPTSYVYNFGKFEYCANSVSQIFKFFNSGLLDDSVAVSFQRNLNGFSIDKTSLFIKSMDSADITVSFDPGQAAMGINTTLLKVNDKTCGQSADISLDAEIVAPSLTISPLVLSYDNVWFGDTLNNQVIITNSTDIPVTIINKTFTSNAIKYETDLNTPFQIPGKTTKIFNIKLIAGLSGSFRDTLYFEYKSECTYDSALFLVANVPDEIYQVKLDIPDYTAQPYDEIAIDVVLTDSVYKFRPDSMNFEVAFDPWLFQPQIVHYLTNTGTTELETNFLPGLVSVKVPRAYADTLFLTKGNKFRISGKTYPSNPDKTVLDIKNVYLYSNKKIAIKDDDGSLEVIPVCHPTAGQHLILSGFITLKLKKEVIGNDVLELEINSSLQTDATFNLFGINGIMVEEQNMSFEKGPNDKNINLQNLPNGAYYFVLNSSTGQTFIHKFILLK